FKAGAPFLQGEVDEIPALGVGEQVKGNEQRRSLGGQSANAALRGMDSLQQLVERQPSLHRHHDFAVDDEAAWPDIAQGGDDLGEVTGERLFRLRLQVDVV